MDSLSKCETSLKSDYDSVVLYALLPEDVLLPRLFRIHIIRHYYQGVSSRQIVETKMKIDRNSGRNVTSAHLYRRTYPIHLYSKNIFLRSNILSQTHHLKLQLPMSSKLQANIISIATITDQLNGLVPLLTLYFFTFVISISFLFFKFFSKKNENFITDGFFGVWSVLLNRF